MSALTKTPTVALGEVCEVKRGTSITAKNTVPGEVPVVAGGRTPAYYHNEANRPANIITVSGSGAYAGFVNYFTVPIFASDCSTVRPFDESKAQTKYIYYCMLANQQWIYDKKRGAAQPHIYPSDLIDMRIPLPPLMQQKNIVARLNRQMAVVEGMRIAAEEKVAALRLLPSALLRQVFNYNKTPPHNWQWKKLSEVCELNPRKPPKINRTDDASTTFVPMAAVNAITGMAQAQERPYGEVRKGYTYFANDDVLFAKITPCMQNGKHFIALNARGGFGFASTEFHVLRCGECILSQWVHFYLRQESILAEAVHHFTGSAGQKRLPQEYLQKLHIPLPPLTEQKQIIKRLDRQMATIEKAQQAADEELEAINALPHALLRQTFAIE